MRPLKIAGYSALAIASLLVLAGLAVYLTLRASLPELDGDVPAPTLQAQPPSRAMSWAHRRFARLRAAISLSPPASHTARIVSSRWISCAAPRRASWRSCSASRCWSWTRNTASTAFADRADAIVQDSAAVDRELLDAYTAGVNFALQSAGARPWEYTLLRSQPVPWRVEDSVLVAFSMYLNLNDSSGDGRAGARAAARSSAAAAVRLPASARHRVGRADRRRHLARPPDSGRGSLRSSFGRCAHRCAQHAAVAGVAGRRAVRRQQQLGRCGHACAGQRGAVRQRHASELAAAAHLVSRTLDRRSPATEAPRDLVGVTLPGLPMLIAGSNGRIAWGYTNSYGDLSDVVVVETDPQDPERYLTDARLRAVRESRRDAGNPRRQAGVPRRAEHALGTDRRLRRRRPAARARLDGARSARHQSAHARLRDRDERRRGAAASPIAPAVRCRTCSLPTRTAASAGR